MSFEEKNDVSSKKISSDERSIFHSIMVGTPFPRRWNFSLAFILRQGLKNFLGKSVVSVEKNNDASRKKSPLKKRNSRKL